MIIFMRATVMALALMLSAVQAQAATDYSANKPTIPNVGANFGGSGPYANYVLLSTVPVTIQPGTQFQIEIQNQSTSQVVFIMDDGTAAAGSPPVNATIDVLSAATVAGGQGQSWNSSYERGRIQIYAASSGAQVSVRTR